MLDKWEVPPDQTPILPEIIVAALANIAACEHQTEDNTVVAGPSTGAVEYISRVMREEPQAMIDAMLKEMGTDEQQGRRQTMFVARCVVGVAQSLTGKNVPMITIGDLKDIMEKYHPRLFPLIPKVTKKTHTAFNSWLKEAKLTHLEQRRGKAKSAGMKAFEAWAANNLPDQK